MYDGGTRVCQIARWPGTIEAGATCDVPVTSTDLYPTLLAAAGLDLLPAQHADGVDLMPLLAGADRVDRDAIFWHYPHYANQGGRPASSVRAGRWKLIEHFEDGRLELFDLAVDPAEEDNRVDAEPAVAARLHQRLCEWRDDVEARIPQPNPNYAPPPLPAGVDPAEV